MHSVVVNNQGPLGTMTSGGRAMVNIYLRKLFLNMSHLLLEQIRKLHCNYTVMIHHVDSYSIFNKGNIHDDVIKWKHFPRYWPFVRGIHWSPVNSTHKGQRRGALMFSLIGVWINAWVNNREAGDLRHHSVHYDVIVMYAVLFYLNTEAQWR